MATGDPYCPAHGYTPCRCAEIRMRSIAAPDLTTPIKMGNVFEIPPPQTAKDEEIVALEAEVDELEEEVADLKAKIARLQEQGWKDVGRITALEKVLREVRHESGVEFDDERVGYLTVQIDRDVWDALAAALRPSSETPGQVEAS